MSEELSVIEKIFALQDEGVVQFHEDRGELYIGDTHVPRNRKLTPAEVTRMYTESLGRLASSHDNYVEPSELVETLKEHLAQMAIEARAQRIADGSLFNNATEFVNYWLERWKVTIGDNGLIYLDMGIFTGNGNTDTQTIGINNLISKLKVLLSEYNLQEDTVPFNRDDIQHILSDLLFSKQRNKITTLKESIKYTGEYSHDELVRWAKGVLNVFWVTHGEGNTVRDEDAYMFLHMLWQVKRKIFLKPVDSELVYSFYSIEQGLGKTSLIADICAPFSFAYGTIAVTEMLDKNNRMSLSEGMYVIDMIELTNMSVGDKVNADQVASMFKSLVGNNNNDVSVEAVRQFHTQNKMVKEQTATYVATTNVQINTVVSDSDMRRFWEFKLTPPRNYDIDNWVKAKPYTEDILNIYKSINENDKYGYYHPMHPLYKDMHRKCREIQKTLAKGNAFTDWLDLHGIEVSDVEEDGYERIPLETLRKRFIRFKDKEGFLTKQFTVFYITSVLKNSFGIEPEVVKEGNNINRFIYVRNWG